MRRGGRCKCRSRCKEATARGNLEGHIARVDGVPATVAELHLDARDREADEDAAIEGADLVVLDAAQLSHIDQAEDFTRTVVDFLRD